MGRKLKSCPNRLCCHSHTRKVITQPYCLTSAYRRSRAHRSQTPFIKHHSAVKSLFLFFQCVSNSTGDYVYSICFFLSCCHIKEHFYHVPIHSDRGLVYLVYFLALRRWLLSGMTDWQAVASHLKFCIMSCHFQKAHLNIFQPFIYLRWMKGCSRCSFSTTYCSSSTACSITSSFFLVWVGSNKDEYTVEAI